MFVAGVDLRIRNGGIMEQMIKRMLNMCRSRITRSGFLKVCGGLLVFSFFQNKFAKYALAAAPESTGRQKKDIKTEYDLVVATGNDPYNNTVKAVEAMGGMGRFVKKGDVVVVKPNIGWDRSPAQGANTEPAVVAALIDMCFKEGARKVNVFDVPCDDEKKTYENSGIAKIAKEHGANVYFANHWNIVSAKFPYKSPMEKWPILRDAVDCDVFINVPVLKHHALTGLTLSIKNLMGVCSGMRGKMHVDIGNKVSDMADFIKPELTVMDATRVLLRNGPTGGNLADVAVFNKVIVGVDPVLVDAYSASLVNREPASISYIRLAAEKKLGSMDIDKAKVFNLTV